LDAHHWFQDLVEKGHVKKFDVDNEKELIHEPSPLNVSTKDKLIGNGHINNVNINEE